MNVRTRDGVMSVRSSVIVAKARPPFSGRKSGCSSAPPVCTWGRFSSTNAQI